MLALENQTSTLRKICCCPKQTDPARGQRALRGYFSTGWCEAHSPPTRHIDPSRFPVTARSVKKHKKPMPILKRPPWQSTSDPLNQECSLNKSPLSRVQIRQSDHVDIFHILGHQTATEISCMGGEMRSCHFFRELISLLSDRYAKTATTRPVGHRRTSSSLNSTALVKTYDISYIRSLITTRKLEIFQRGVNVNTEQSSTNPTLGLFGGLKSICASTIEALRDPPKRQPAPTTHTLNQECAA